MVFLAPFLQHVLGYPSVRSGDVIGLDGASGSLDGCYTNRGFTVEIHADGRVLGCGKKESCAAAGLSRNILELQEWAQVTVLGACCPVLRVDINSRETFQALLL